MLFLSVLAASLLILLPGCGEKETDEPGEEPTAQETPTPAQEPTGQAQQPSERPAAPTEVVVYVSADQQFAQPILDKFEEQSGLTVNARYDTELTKTTGLVTRLREESATGRPQADVFWSSEIFNTIALAEEGLFQPTNAQLDFQPRWGSAAQGWYGFAPRPRVLAYDPRRVSEDQLPRLWLDLAHPRFSGRLAMADPSAGTTGGHVAAWFVVYGELMTREFLEQMTDQGLLVVGGNSLAVRRLVDGEVDFAMTDADDVWAARRNGATLEMSYPRHTDLPGGGTLVIPNTAARVRGGPNGDAADELIAYLVSAEVERALAESASRNLPTHPSLQQEFAELIVEDPLDVPFEEVADAMPRALEVAAEVLD
jgi:iron(III) transport system substrate-binding protein